MGGVDVWCRSAWRGFIWLVGRTGGVEEGGRGGQGKGVREGGVERERRLRGERWRPGQCNCDRKQVCGLGLGHYS